MILRVGICFLIAWCAIGGGLGLILKASGMGGMANPVANTEMVGGIILLHVSLLFLLEAGRVLISTERSRPRRRLLRYRAIITSPKPWCCSFAVLAKLRSRRAVSFSANRLPGLRRKARSKSDWLRSNAWPAPAQHEVPVRGGPAADPCGPDFADADLAHIEPGRHLADRQMIRAHQPAHHGAGEHVVVSSGHAVQSVRLAREAPFRGR